MFSLIIRFYAVILSVATGARKKAHKIHNVFSGFDLMDFHNLKWGFTPSPLLALKQHILDTNPGKQLS
jgi:hypothetical protein